jgi:hypothetical protein
MKFTDNSYDMLKELIAGFAETHNIEVSLVTYGVSHKPTTRIDCVKDAHSHEIYIYWNETADMATTVHGILNSLIDTYDLDVAGIYSKWPKTNPYLDYINTDIKVTNTLAHHWIYGGRCNGKTEYMKQLLNIIYGYHPNPMSIKNVIFNNPATIVFWEDGTKTVVKAQDGDVYDPEKGLAMAITKKALGNKGNYCNELKKWLEKYEPSDGPTVINLQIVGDKYREALDAWDEFIRRHGDPVPDGDNN